jgi:GT2 family glycosyltransferase
VEPLVSIVVVTWNGLPHLERCLPAVLSQELRHGQDFEVLVVDNASTDGSLPYLGALARDDARIQVIRNARNEGFAGPNNRAFGQARGRYVVTLNNDTLPEPGWLAALVEAAEGDAHVGSVASQMVFGHAPAIIQSAGIVIDRAGIAWDRLVGRPIAESDAEVTPVFGASGGAALYRREVLAELGGFDACFFMYLEDVDLAWRAQLAGWKAVYQPRAVVRHAHSGSAVEGSPFKNWHLGRNKVWTIAKCYPSPGLQCYLPLIVAYDLASLPYTVATKRDLSPLRGRLAALRGLRPIWDERRRLHARYPGGWERTKGWMQPVEPPWAVFARYRRLRHVLRPELKVER